MSVQPDTDQLVAVRIDPDGTITPISDDSTDTTAGNDVELAALPGERSCILWVTADGTEQLARNHPAETVWFLAGDRGCLAGGDTITGPCVITGPAGANGEPQPAPSWILEAASAVATRRSRRFPMAPLEDLLNARYRNLSSTADRQCRGRLSTERIAELIGFTRQAVGRWRADGVPRWSADRAAINAGTHPLEVWPDFHADIDGATAARPPPGGTAMNHAVGNQRRRPTRLAWVRPEEAPTGASPSPPPHRRTSMTPERRARAMTGDHRPFDPPYVHTDHLRRLRHTYHGYGGGLRGALAAWGYLGGRINGTARINRAGNRWLNLRGPGLQHPARRHLADILAGAVIAAPFLVGLTMVDDPASAPVGKGLIAVFEPGISLC